MTDSKARAGLMPTVVSETNAASSVGDLTDAKKASVDRHAFAALEAALPCLPAGVVRIVQEYWAVGVCGGEFVAQTAFSYSLSTDLKLSRCGQRVHVAFADRVMTYDARSLTLLDTWLPRQPLVEKGYDIIGISLFADDGGVAVLWRRMISPYTNSLRVSCFAGVGAFTSAAAAADGDIKSRGRGSTRTSSVGNSYSDIADSEGDVSEVAAYLAADSGRGGRVLCLAPRHGLFEYSRKTVKLLRRVALPGPKDDAYRNGLTVDEATGHVFVHCADKMTINELDADLAPLRELCVPDLPSLHSSLASLKKEQLTALSFNLCGNLLYVHARTPYGWCSVVMLSLADGGETKRSEGDPADSKQQQGQEQRWRFLGRWGVMDTSRPAPIGIDQCEPGGEPRPGELIGSVRTAPDGFGRVFVTDQSPRLQLFY